MPLIDSHCHLNDGKFKDDLDEVITRSEESGIMAMICVGTDLKSSEHAIDIADRYESVFATCGVHPHEAEKAEADYLKHLEAFSTHEKVVAIGEMGLDYHYNFSKPAIQKKVFRDQLDLAKSLQLPAVIHNRNSDDDLMIILKESGHFNGVVHCFSSGIKLAESLIQIGLKLSFTGMVTFVKSLSDIIEKVPIEKMMVETDSPYLAPVPFRGIRCEPGYVTKVAEKIAEIKNLPMEAVADTTTLNTVEFFNLPLS